MNNEIKEYLKVLESKVNKMEGSSSTVVNYADLSNKPKLEGVTLEGNVRLNEDRVLLTLANSEIDEIIDSIV